VTEKKQHIIFSKKKKYGLCFVKKRPKKPRNQFQRSNYATWFKTNVTSVIIIYFFTQYLYDFEEYHLMYFLENLNKLLLFFSAALYLPTPQNKSPGIRIVDNNNIRSFDKLKTDELKKLFLMEKQKT
jgi:hypothetical protein